MSKEAEGCRGSVMHRCGRCGDCGGFTLDPRDYKYTLELVISAHSDGMETRLNHTHTALAAWSLKTP